MIEITPDQMRILETLNAKFKFYYCVKQFAYDKTTRNVEQIPGREDEVHCIIIDITTGRSYVNACAEDETTAFAKALDMAITAEKPRTQAQEVSHRLMQERDAKSAEVAVAGDRIAQLEAQIARMEAMLKQNFGDRSLPAEATPPPFSPSPSAPPKPRNVPKPIRTPDLEQV